MRSKIISKSKKGDEPAAGSSAVMLVIIAAIIIFYLLSVPPVERQRLLDGDDIDDDNGGTLTGSSTFETETLIKENIGRLVKMPFSEKNHEMSAVTVSTQINAEVISNKNSLYIRNSIFTKKFPTIEFEIDPDHSNNLKLSFNVETASGVLMLYLNGQEIFAGEMKYTSPPAIELPSSALKEDNTLLFYLYRPTWAFWRINEYQLVDVNILGEIEDISKDSASIDFAITDVEYVNIDQATFFFIPDCTINDVGKLNVYLNNRKIYSAVPDCGVQNYVILDTFDISSGKNTLGFKTDKGTYLIDQPRVKTKLKDQIFPVYYFDLEDKYFYEEEEDNDEADYKYFCGIDEASIYLEHEGESIDTEIDCDNDEDCNGNFRRYYNPKTDSTVRNALCEELDDDEFKYFCDEDDRSILIKTEDIVDDTGWNCNSGKTCEGNYELYNSIQLESMVKDEICEYDEDTGNDYFGEAELQGKYNVDVRLRFNNNDYKELTVWINGYRKHVSTRDSLYEFNIDTYVFPGSNSVELVPDTADISITELRVELAENE